MRLFCSLLCVLVILMGCSANTIQVFTDETAVDVTESQTEETVIPVAITISETSETESNWINASAKLVAHAGGNIDGIQGTNTIDSVEYNYSLGHRVFELDFNLTSDNVLVGIHDWGAKNIAPTWQEFSSKKISGRYTPTTYEQFIRFLSEHKDAYIVTDTKSYDLTDEQISKQFQIMYDICERVDSSTRERIIVQVYNQNMYHLINKIYKYPNILYTLYATPDTEEQVLKFVKAEGIPVVVMPPERANQPFLNNLLALDVKVYLHTLNDFDDVKQWQAKGVWGVYTDSLLPGDFGQ